MLNFTKTVVGASYIVISHPVRKEQNNKKDGPRAMEIFVVLDVQSNMTKVRTVSNKVSVTLTFGHFDFKRDRTVVISVFFL